MTKIRVFTAFSGYDSQCLALERLKRDYPSFDYELIGWSEIDKYAIQAHNALFPDWAECNYGDISKIDWAQVPDFDLFTYSSPCQDFSNAGLQRGGEEGSGTRSSLLWECRKAMYMELCLNRNTKDSHSISAPTQSLLQRWLRVEKGYYVYPFFDNESKRWTWVCRELTGDMWIQLLDFEERYFDTYELALEDALKYALGNLV